jgi:hypothetical protein
MPLTNSRKDWEQAPDCNVSARLYKLLLYEPGDFFARHRDTERMNGMFGCYRIALRTYQGTELTIWSPLTPSENKAYGGQGERLQNALHGCYHQVSKQSRQFHHCFFSCQRRANIDGSGE